MAREWDEFMCPISMSVMEDPVVLAETGVTYERAEIAAWFAQGKDTCPCTGVRVSSQQLVPNRALKAAIDRWKETSTDSPKTPQVPKPMNHDSESKDGFWTACLPYLRRLKWTAQPTADAGPSRTVRHVASREKANQMTAAVRRKDENLLYQFQKDFWSFDVLDDSGRGPIHVAAIQDDLRMANLLLGCGCSAGLKDKSGCTALHWAARLGHAALCKTLLTAGADVNAPNVAKTTPLHMAAFWGRLNVVTLLVQHGANIHALNEKQQRPIDVAKQSPWDSAKSVVPLLHQYASQ